MCEMYYHWCVVVHKSYTLLLYTAWLGPVVKLPGINRRTSARVRETLSEFEEDFNKWCRTQPSVRRGGEVS